jgi:hypothetical protein
LLNFLNCYLDDTAFCMILMLLKQQISFFSL